MNHDETSLWEITVKSIEDELINDTPIDAVVSVNGQPFHAAYIYLDSDNCAKLRGHWGNDDTANDEVYLVAVDNFSDLHSIMNSIHFIEIFKDKLHE